MRHRGGGTDPTELLKSARLAIYRPTGGVQHRTESSHTAGYGWRWAEIRGASSFVSGRGRHRHGLAGSGGEVLYAIVVFVVDDTNGGRRAVRPVDVAEIATTPPFHRGWSLLVTFAVGAVAALIFMSSAEERTDTALVSSTVPEATLLLSSVPDSTLSGVTNLDMVGLPHMSGSIDRFQDVPLNRLWGTSVVWTGREIIAWGGRLEVGAQPTMGGAAFDPDTGSWRSISEPHAVYRQDHAAVWADDRMLVWGGMTQVFDGKGMSLRWLADGAAYDPESDEWADIPDAPFGSQPSPAAVWTGTEMVIFGTQESDKVTTLPAVAFNPDTESWRLLPDLSVPAGPFDADALAAVWTGEAVVLSGAAIGVDIVAIYRPGIDEWETLSVPLGYRSGHTVVWTGTEVIVWGGSERDSDHAVGYAVDAETSLWRTLPEPPVTERTGHGATWTGTELLMWGGSPVRPMTNTQERLSFRVLYNPRNNQWTVVDVPAVHGGAFGWPPTQIVWLGESALLWKDIAQQSGILALDPAEPSDSR